MVLTALPLPCLIATVKKSDEIVQFNVFKYISNMNSSGVTSSTQYLKKKSDLVLKSDLRKSFEQNRLVVNTDKGVEVISCKDILRCEVDKTNCIFHLVNGKILRVSKSLKFYESKLREWDFIRVHQSNMVNLRHVEGYVRGRGGSVVLSDNTMIPVAIRKKPRLLKVFQIS